MGNLYRTDLSLWAAQQAQALRHAARERTNAAVDWTNVAEEIEILGVSERRTLASHIGTVVKHLMKLRASPASRPRRGWIGTILQARGEIEKVLEDSPSLRWEVGAMIAGETILVAPLVAYEPDRRGESTRAKLARLTYTGERVLGPWLPDGERPG